MTFKKPKNFYLHEDDRIMDELNKLLFDFMKTNPIYPKLFNLTADSWNTWPEPRTGDIIHRDHSTTAGDYQLNNYTTTTTIYDKTFIDE